MRVIDSPVTRMKCWHFSPLSKNMSKRHLSTLMPMLRRRLPESQIKGSSVLTSFQHLLVMSRWHLYRVQLFYIKFSQFYFRHLQFHSWRLKSFLWFKMRHVLYQVSYLSDLFFFFFFLPCFAHPTLWSKFIFKAWINRMNSSPGRGQ